MLIKFVILYTMFFSFLISTLYINTNKRYYTIAKAVNSIGFILVAAYGGVVLGNTAFYSMLPALIFCLFGDVFLGIHTQCDTKVCFLAGIFSFTAAHIAYTFAFSNIAPLSIYDFIFPTLSIFIAYMLTKLENMEIEKRLKKYTIIYSFFVSLLLSKSISILFVSGITTEHILIFLGSLMFFISDFIIFFLYFYKKKHHLVGTFNLLFYYYGMLFLALSLWY